MFKQRVQRFIDEKALLTPSDKVLVALSGGADSVALIRVLLSLGYTCECAHCNFHLRGEESDRDETFVRHLCQKLNVKLHITHFDTNEFAKEQHLSIEMAARKLRYDWFEELRKQNDASAIAVAHHRDDSVETFMLNLIRGTGINGLKGIAARNGHIIRPLLKESRESVIDYLNGIGQDFITDSTNLQDEYMRNKIRLNILP
ncbi:MAG: tRNA lysidine(34) synthetase TilS, partial [Rikenellaceae bacterium]|nr:tRNA lysidine(34) synthetase TilS [Rikenellaceae bacterium]